jgi:hydroxymethylglutaryl-CoA lyase
VNSDANKKAITLVEVSMRDGLQSQSTVLSPQKRAELLAGFMAAGHRHLEVGSYVSAKAIPQLENSSKVVQLLSQQAGFEHTETIALVFNKRGAAQAAVDPITCAGFVCACSDSFNRSNMGKSATDSLVDYAEMAITLRQAGKKLRFYLSTITYCASEGAIPLRRLEQLCESILSKVAPDELILSDTLGAVLPWEVDGLVDVAEKYFDSEQLGFHFHDPYGTALLNVQAAMDRGVRRFDMSAAGIGGCPNAANAQGNVASEELLHYLHAKGLARHIDLPRHLSTTAGLLGALGANSLSKAYHTLNHNQGGEPNE